MPKSSSARTRDRAAIAVALLCTHRRSSVVEGQRPTLCELIDGRRALDFGAMHPRGRFKIAGLDTHGTCEEAAAFLHVLGVEVFDRRRSGHREAVRVALGSDMDAVFCEPHQDLFAGA